MKIKGIIYSVLLIGIVAINIIGNMFGYGHESTSSSARTPSTHRVLYQVTTNRLHGDCFAFDVTYEMPDGTAQKSGGVCSGKESVVVAERNASRGDFLYLSVQNDKWSSTIGCAIYIDGKLIYHTTSQGQYVIASCSGSVD